MAEAKGFLKLNIYIYIYIYIFPFSPNNYIDASTVHDECVPGIVEVISEFLHNV